MRFSLDLTQGLTVKKSRESKGVKADHDGDNQIAVYSQAQPLPFRTICERLRELIEAGLPKATSKVWHGSPVWFIEDHPVVGYNATKKTVNILFWYGQAFDEPGLVPAGKHRAAQALFRDAAEIDPTLIRRWLKHAKSSVLDSKAFYNELREKK